MCSVNVIMLHLCFAITALGKIIKSSFWESDHSNFCTKKKKKIKMQLNHKNATNKLKGLWFSQDITKDKAAQKKKKKSRDDSTEVCSEGVKNNTKRLKLAWEHRTYTFSQCNKHPPAQSVCVCVCVPCRLLLRHQALSLVTTRRQRQNDT